MFKTPALAIFVLVCAALRATPADGGITKEFIFETAPFASAHALNIVELRSGKLLATWFGGSGEGQPDVAIWSAEYDRGKWSTPVVLAREAEIACFNPVAFYTNDGRLWLYYKFGPSPDRWSAARRWSDNDGATWSAVEHLPAGLYGPIRTRPLLLLNGVASDQLRCVARRTFPRESRTELFSRRSFK